MNRRHVSSFVLGLAALAALVCSPSTAHASFCTLDKSLDGTWRSESPTGDDGIIDQVSINAQCLNGTQSSCDEESGICSITHGVRNVTNVGSRVLDGGEWKSTVRSQEEAIDDGAVTFDRSAPGLPPTMKVIYRVSRSGNGLRVQAIGIRQKLGAWPRAGSVSLFPTPVELGIFKRQTFNVPFPANFGASLVDDD